MVKIIKFLFGFIVAISLLSSCTIDKVIDYSFYVEKHGDYKSDGLCFGIDDQLIKINIMNLWINP